MVLTDAGTARIEEAAASWEWVGATLRACIQKGEAVLVAVSSCSHGLENWNSGNDLRWRLETWKLGLEPPLSMSGLLIWEMDGKRFLPSLPKPHPSHSHSHLLVELRLVAFPTSPGRSPPKAFSPLNSTGLWGFSGGVLAIALVHPHFSLLCLQSG